MKKKIWVPIATILLLAGAAMVFSALHPAPKVIIFEDELHKSEKTFNKDNVKFLNQIGFDKSRNVENNLPEVYDQQIKYYKDKYGLEYFADKIIDRALGNTGLIIGSSHQYAGTIPDKNIDEIKAALAKLDAGNTVNTSSDFVDFIVRNESGNIIDGIKEDDPRAPDKSWFNSMRDIGRTFRPNANTVLPGQYPSFTTISYEPHTPWIKSINNVGQLKPFELLIIASSEQFVLNPDQVIQNNKIENKPKVRDPMVLLKVNGGYLKLTSWN